VGVDPTPAQLATARRCEERFGLGLEFVEAFAEDVPLPDASFDLAVSEYGASIWADPYRWIPEAARLLRPGGELVFLRNSVLFSLCAPDSEDPAGDRLLRGYFDLHRIEWSDDGAVNFSLGVGALLRLFRASGFEVLGCIEPRPAEGATTFFRYATPVWAHRWPSEEIWRVRKARGGAAGL
jgi:SAM-dependent methyltransferase